jgi:hypothetical protein
VAYVVLGLLAAWYFAVRHGSVAGIIVGCVLAVALLAAAWRVLRARLVIDSDGLTDYRAVWTVRGALGGRCWLRGGETGRAVGRILCSCYPACG